MKVHRLISAPGGDIPATGEILQTPYRVSLSDCHPTLTLEDYFAAAEDFLRRGLRESMAVLPGGPEGQPVAVEDITDIRIRSEKHGALYHLASVEVSAGPRSFKAALSAAVSEQGKRCLEREWNTLTLLGRKFHLPYLPLPYYWGEVRGRGPDTFSMLASQWFEGFHEWHLSMDEHSGEQGLVIWDGSVENRWVGPGEIVDIYRKSATILTLYYDTRTFRQIDPWRHAAGDFVVRTGAGRTDVRLTTARNYVRVMDRMSGEEVHPIIALVYFFLDMVTRTRVDRLDGTGDVAWAGTEAVEGAVRGFIEGLLRKEARGEYHLGAVADLIALLKRFARHELDLLFAPLRVLYERGDPEELEVILRNLAAHIRDVHTVIQALPPAGPAESS